MKKIRFLGVNRILDYIVVIVVLKIFLVELYENFLEKGFFYWII